MQASSALDDGEDEWLRRELLDDYTVDAHSFIVAAQLLVRALDVMERQDLLNMIPGEHAATLRNAYTIDDKWGLYEHPRLGGGAANRRLGGHRIPATR